MIDDGVFRNWWADLCERFRMTGEDAPSQRQMKRYYRYLSARMDTDDFEAAAEAVWAEREFFPRPADFVEAARGDAESAAMDAWERVLEMAKNWRSAAPAEELGRAGRKALAQVGGIKKLALSDRSDLDFRRRDFLDAYRAALASTAGADTDRLPPMSDEGQSLLREATAGTRLEVSD